MRGVLTEVFFPVAGTAFIVRGGALFCGAEVHDQRYRKEKALASLRSAPKIPPEVGVRGHRRAVARAFV